MKYNPIIISCCFVVFKTYFPYMKQVCQNYPNIIDHDIFGLSYLPDLTFQKWRQFCCALKCVEMSLDKE